ncbi:MAG: hypothetical protein HF967_00205 [Methanosarcinales archaeon]|nr:hypothetical protein [Methanosarcinales archaeon]
MKFQDFYFSITIILSMILGLVFSNQFILLAPFTIFFLMAILFLSALKFNFKEIIASVDSTKKQVVILLATIFTLVFLPIIAFYLTDLIYPTLAPAFFILSLAPVGMTVPFLVDIMKGDKGLALILVIFTSLLAPFTIPFLINLILGGIVNINLIGMFISLTKIIFIPFILAFVVKYLFPEKIKQTSKFFNNISTISLGLLLATIVATHSNIIIPLFSRDGLFYLITLLFLFAFTYILSYLFFYKIEDQKRFAIIICSVFMNFTLMIVMANKFFYNYDEIVIPIVLSVIPWSISLIILRQIARKNPSKLKKK